MKKKFYFLILSIWLSLTCLCVWYTNRGDRSWIFSGDEKPRVVIWTSGEDYRNEYYLSESRKRFPEYDIVLEYMNTATIAAKVMEEGERCEADILLSEEYNYLDKCIDFLADLPSFDFSVYLDEVLPRGVASGYRYVPEALNTGCIVLNVPLLKERGLDVPKSYRELLDVKYKGLISAPSPMLSGTGYIFLKSLVNAWGEDEAFDYFRNLSENVLQFTSSGSGPINMLLRGEAAIGFGITHQAVTERNRGASFDVVIFDEGTPYNMYGNAVLKKSVAKPGVMEVFNYLSTDLSRGNNERFCADQVFKGFVPNISGYPYDAKRADMSGDSLKEKERLLSRWDL